MKRIEAFCDRNTRSNFDRNFDWCHRSYLILTTIIDIPANCVESGAKNRNRTQWCTEHRPLRHYCTAHDRCQTTDHSRFVQAISHPDPSCRFIAQTLRFNYDVFHFGFECFFQLIFECIMFIALVHLTNHLCGCGLILAARPKNLGKVEEKNRN